MFSDGGPNAAAARGPTQFDQSSQYVDGAGIFAVFDHTGNTIDQKVAISMRAEPFNTFAFKPDSLVRMTKRFTAQRVQRPQSLFDLSTGR
jgi:hypothetical protein